MQLKAYLEQTKSPVEALDLHGPLIQAKPQGVVYFPQDTHWNGRGYFTGYQAMCAALARWFPEIRPQRLGTDYALQAQPSLDGEWSLFGLPGEGLKYKSEYLAPLGTQHAHKEMAPFPHEITPPPLSWQAPLYWEGPGKKSLLFFHDSFMRAGLLHRDEVPLAEHFARTMLVGMQPSEYELDVLVEMYHPDVVIEERAERFLAAVPAPLLDASRCSHAEDAIGGDKKLILQSVNATVDQRPSGLVVTASNNGPYFYLPELTHPIQGLTIRITTPDTVSAYIYAVGGPGFEWAKRPRTVRLHPGLNELSLLVPPETTRIRIDPGDKPLTYTIHQVRYLNGCR